jgi:hypothetical protein
MLLRTRIVFVWCTNHNQRMTLTRFVFGLFPLATATQTANPIKGLQAEVAALQTEIAALTSLNTTQINVDQRSRLLLRRRLITRTERCRFESAKGGGL